jgi:phosphate uptake regulator
MERTLIRQGGGGYTIYLPKHWVDKKGLQAGERIQLIETETSLLVTSGAEQKQAAVVKITDSNRADLTNILTHLYRRGVESITFQGADPKTVAKIATLAQDLLLGFEMTERDAKSCKLENLSEPSEQKYDLLLKRIFLIIKETHRLFSQELAAGKYGDEVATLRDQLDKYVLFCRRSLVKEKELRSISTQWELLTFLMHIDHAYFYLHRYAAEHKVKSTARLVDLVEETGNYIDLYYDSFYKKDIGAIHKINSLRDELIFGKCYTYALEAKGPEIIVISHFRELLRLIQIGMSPILSELLQGELA